MTQVSNSHLSVGLREAVAFRLNTAGLPDADSTAVYEGYTIPGPKAYTLTIPEPRKISHMGNDRVLALDYLPPTEGASGELRASVHDLDLIALLSGVKAFDIADATMVPWVTDMQGSEPNIGLLMFQQSLDKASKLRRWRFHIAPSARIYPIPAGMDENASEARYQFAPNPSTKHLWGASLVTGTEGATEAALVEGMAEGKPKIVAWKADGAEDNFLFPTGKPAFAVGKVKVWDNGSPVSPTVTTTDITFGVAPTASHIIVAYYEY